MSLVEQSEGAMKAAGRALLHQARRSIGDLIKQQAKERAQAKGAAPDRAQAKTVGQEHARQAPRPEPGRSR